MVKRKQSGQDTTKPSKVARTATPPPQPDASSPDSTINLQLVAGTYEKILHGFIATIPIASLSTQSKSNSTEVELKTTFVDTFLFTAHTAALRCLAISPATDSTSDPKSVNNQTATTRTKTAKRILATGSPDEKINLYTLASTIKPIKPVVCNNDFNIPSAAPTSTGSNRHLGALHEHTNTVTRILFTPSRNKMISTGEDNRILIWKTRDWSLLSEIKAPKPKTTTAALGGIGTGGVYDIALHPSQKILFSVAKGERCLRMWNMMTGKKAGVLGWTKDQVDVKMGGSVRDGRKILWNGEGTQFVVGFERGALVYGMNSEPVVKILPGSKVTQMRFLSVPASFTTTSAPELLAISTEDGRIIFYDLPPTPSPTEEESGDEEENPIPELAPTGEIGGLKVGMVTRIKDFTATTVIVGGTDRIIVSTGSSDGTVRVWLLDPAAAAANSIEATNVNKTKKEKKDKTSLNISAEEAAELKRQQAETKKEMEKVVQFGKLLGIYETGRRITCLDGMKVELDEEVDEDEVDDVSMGEDSDSESDDE